MTIAWFKDRRQDRNPLARGGAPVGIIAELPNVERAAILLLRTWCEGEAGRMKILADFTKGFGVYQGQAEYDRLGHLIGVVIQGGRRAFMRHAVDCTCFGGDESAFANMVAAAAAGDRDDAMAFALVLMTPAAAFSAVQTAEVTGLAIAGLSRRAFDFSGWSDRNTTKH